MVAIGNYVIQFGTGLCVLLAITEWLKRKKKEPLSKLFWVSLVLSSVQLRIGLTEPKLFDPHPYWIALFPTSIGLTGPLVYFLLLEMMDAAKPRRTALFFSFCPALLALCGELWFYSKPQALQMEILMRARQGITGSFYDLVMLIGPATICLFMFLALHKFSKIRRQYLPTKTRLMWILVVLPITGMLIIIGGYIVKVREMIAAGGCLLTLTYTFFFTFTIQFPLFFQNLKGEIKRKKYAGTQLNGLDKPALRKRLVELMEEEYFFRNESLRLNHLADELLITPHQLSRVLNEDFQMNFNEFVNKYRVEEAKRFLLEHPDWTVLRIGLAVGFSNKTTFNEHFRKFTGRTPVEYRRKNGR